jgi:ankyrin repeat protein
MTSLVDEPPVDEPDMSRHTSGESSNPTSLSRHDLRIYYQSDSVSVDGLRERLFRLQLQAVDMSPYRILPFDICRNERLKLEMVQCVMEFIPGAASAIDARGATPLHIVCLNKNATLNIVRCVYEGCPDAIHVKDQDGQIPLFYLCSNDKLDDANSVEILTLLLEKWPESAQCCTHAGLLPIHLACHRRSPKFCCLLTEAYPDSMQHERNGVGVQVLFHILSDSVVDDSVAFAVLKLLLDKYPEMVRRVRMRGVSLLHWAAWSKIPRATEIFRLLIQASPELVLEDNEGGSLPLHTACARGNFPVVKCILDMCPDAIRGASSGGAFSIHFAVSSLRRYPEAAVEVTQYLLAVDPRVASQEMVNSSLPLFRACEATNESNLRAGLEIIESLFNACPEAIVNIEVRELFIGSMSVEVQDFLDTLVIPVQDFLYTQIWYAAQANNHQLVITPDANGRLPLHNALLRGAPLGSIKLLVQADVSTLQIRDSNGSLPLHNECKRSGRPDVCQYLLDHDSDRTRSLLVTDNQGNTPLHCACLGAKHDVIALLVERYSSAAVAMRNTNEHLPIELLLLASNHGHIDQESASYLNSIFLLLRANPDILTNDDMDSILEVASLSISDV